MRRRRHDRTNNPATGAPTISGTGQVGETLTADTPGIADGEGKTVAHYDPDWLGRDLRDLLGVELPLASGEALWLTHQDVNPATGEVEDKHFWVVGHDGLIFGSGWHHDESGG